MIWTLDWSLVAEQDLLAIPWRLAARVDAAVMAFAEGRAHEGSVERMTESNPHHLRLRLRGASALLLVEPGAGVLHVSRVFRNT